MKKNRNLTFLIIFLAFLATLFLGRQLLFPPQKKLQVVNTVPRLDQTDVSLNQEIILEFNQTVKSKDLDISLFPNVSFQTKEENQKIIITLEENLLPNTQYQLELKDKEGNSFFSLIFQTGKEIQTPSPVLSPPPEATTTGKGSPDALEDLDKRTYQDYPLYSLTPHRTLIWVTDYAAPKKLLVIYKKGELLSSIQEEVFSWIRENNVDPETHIYVWEEREILP